MKNNLEEESTKPLLWISALVLIPALIAVLILYFSTPSTVEEPTEVISVVVAKQSEHVSINNLGAFRTDYYLLYESGDLERVTLKSYMEFNVGDTLIYYKN